MVINFSGIKLNSQRCLRFSHQSVGNLVYHLGYSEFHGSYVVMITAGVGIMSLAYLITGNPFTPLLAHIAIHIAAVLHGLNTVIQLPPYYYQQITAIIVTWLVH